MTYGGEGRTPGKELRDNLSKKLKGKKKPPRTDEHRRNQSLAQKGKPKPKVREGLKKWYASNPDRSESIAKQSASLKEWYKTADKDQKAWNTWHTRYKQDYDEYARAIKLLKQLPIFEVEKQVKFKRDTLRKLKNQNHGVFKHFPELSAQSS